MVFEQLGLAPETLQAISEVGYKTPTPIQAKTIPLLLEGRDIIGLAQTGTGKTAAFVLPLLKLLSRGRAKARMPRSLIIEPTRELAIQVAEDFEIYGKYHSFSVCLLIGGESFGDQEKKLARGADVLIVTPGRLLDMYERGNILLNDVKMLVIDEADRMLDMGFIPDIERIASLLPPHQTALFSATMPPPVRKLAEKFLKTPEEVTVSSPTEAAAHIEQYIIRASERDKTPLLQQFLQEQNFKQAIIFCNRKREVDTVFKALDKKGLAVGLLHGDLTQSLRNKTIKDFKEGDVRILVASDVVARGLDVEDLPVVINFHVPANGEDYIHRVGRTGRAGKEGKAYTFVSPSEEKALQLVLKTLKKPMEEYIVVQNKKAEKAPKSSPSPNKVKTSQEKPPSVPSSSGEAQKPSFGFGEDVPAFMRVKA